MPRSSEEILKQAQEYVKNFSFGPKRVWIVSSLDPERIQMVFGNKLGAEQYSWELYGEKYLDKVKITSWKVHGEIR